MRISVVGSPLLVGQRQGEGKRGVGERGRMINKFSEAMKMMLSALLLMVDRRNDVFIANGCFQVR